jgi:hypothetical protein
MLSDIMQYIALNAMIFIMFSFSYIDGDDFKHKRIKDEF